MHSINHTKCNQEIIQTSQALLSGRFSLAGTQQLLVGPSQDILGFYELLLLWVPSSWPLVLVFPGCFMGDRRGSTVHCLPLNPFFTHF